MTLVPTRPLTDRVALEERKGSLMANRNTPRMPASMSPEGFSSRTRKGTRRLGMRTSGPWRRSLQSSGRAGQSSRTALGGRTFARRPRALQKAASQTATGAKHIRTIFYRMGFTDPEIVALSGAHTLGKCRADRSGFEGPWTETPLRFDTRYFELLLECEWEPSEASTGLPQMACPSEPELMMLNTDVALITDPTFRQTTELYAKDAARFHADFSTAFVKLQEHGHPSLVDVGV